MSRLYLYALVLLSVLTAACGSTPAAKLSKSVIRNDSVGADGSADSGSGTDTPTGTIICKTDDDCAAPTPACDPLRHECVGCLSDANCTASQHCVAKTCFPFTACKNSLDCKDAVGPSGEAQGICDKGIGECVECAGKDDCAASSECLGKRCVAYKDCTNSADCPPDQVCHPTSKRCAECAAAEDCPASHTCEPGTNTAGVCKKFIPCTSDKQCTAQGMLCDKAKGKCAQCLQNADCPAVYHCVDSGPGGTGECILDVCKPGAGSCQGGVKVACNPEGSGYGAPETCGPQTTCTVYVGKVECSPWVCTPGKSCVNGQLVECSADGLDVLSAAPCGDGKACVNGACQAAKCAPGVKFCKDNAVMLCAGDGQSSDVSELCSASQFCQDGACKAQICKPKQASCDGNAVKTCNGDGSGYAGAGQDCGDLKCADGACKKPICQANATYCQGQQLLMCNADGMGGQLVKTCPAGQVCLDGGCKTLVCQANQQGCDGNSANTCNANGTAWTGPGKDCGSQKCIEGICSSLACAPATIYCEGGVLKTCSADGTSVKSQQSCAGGTYCGVGATGDAGCQPMVCSPGQDGCDGKVAAQCNANGSGFKPGGTDCAAAGKVCSGGTCVSLKCDPQNPLYCEGNVAMKCDASGLNPSSLQTCGSGQYCDKGVCQAQVCSPYGMGCNGNVVATCNAVGSAWLAGGTDCAASGGTCAAGKCVTGHVSCAAVLAANKAAADGLYPIDPDGAGPIAPVTLFCDMKNGGLTLVANIYDSAGDDAPNSTDYVVSGWQQTGSGAWNKLASKVDRDATGSGSAAVSLEFVKALGTSAGQKHLKMCFFDNNGAETMCRNSADGTLSLASYAGGNPLLSAYANVPLVYSFARLAGMPGPQNCYDANSCFGSGYCIGVQPGGWFGDGCTTQKGICGFGGVGAAQEQPGFVWHGFCGGEAYAPYRTAAAGNLELAGVTPSGFRLYVLSQPSCGNGIKEAGETCDDGNTAGGDGCSAVCQIEIAWKLVKSEALTSQPAGAIVENGLYGSQGVASIGGRTAWVMNSDWNSLSVLDGLDSNSAGWAVEVDAWKAGPDRSWVVALRAVHTWKGGANMQSGVECGDVPPQAGTCYAVANWSQTMVGSNLVPSAAGTWRTQRIEFMKNTGKFTAYLDGQFEGSWSVDPAVLVGPYVLLWGGSPCCKPTQVGFSNLKIYQAN